ncbi:HAMP domain-containing protein [Alteromonas aestuariivivens]|uniref:histidine kinase n=1 Tax=Alteromonas aestuariivivens TaxID=1938339 RepID=A0A3D8MA74_9ALTE|nr:ATP-binding protein [Alteromonas aestuariivivens]RDV26685.1 HAMP domain-containing protein [Alteromonas aestuariivivens]
MIYLNRLNPTRRLVGRVFLWFWMTFLVTAMLALWLGRMLVEDVDFGTPQAQDVVLLEQGRQRILQHEQSGRSIRQALVRSGRSLRHRLLAVELGARVVVRTEGRPPLHREMDDLIKMAGQPTPISLIRGPMKLTGPLQFEYQGKQYALFTATMTDRPAYPRTLPWLILLAVAITIVLSYWFAKSLAKPILQLQKTSQELAKGNLRARIQTGLERQDELGQLARDFNGMAQQLERLWTAQKRLLADISHELRSPLARLQMAVGLAHQQQVEPGALDRIEREADRMESMINQLLQLARAEADAPQMQTIMLPDLLDGLLADAHFEATICQRHFVISLIPDCKVVGNPELLCSAVENVIRNAIHYSELNVDAEITADASHWKITIVDDGPGLSEEECSAIFDPFYRASLARDRKSGGVGLGLAIAKTAVELHHGTIQARPAANGGLAVTLSFPLDGSTKWSGT